MSDEKLTRLATEATRLNKAVIIGLALYGKPEIMRPSILEIPNYLLFQIKPLKRCVEDLRRLVNEIFSNFISLDWKPAGHSQAIRWLADKHDDWMRSNQPQWELGRVYEVERAIGRLVFRKHMECPAYAQVLIQGFSGAAIRHPEYHLARDLTLLNRLFLDAESIADEHLKHRRPHSTENSQSLARSVILTCYNLLEAFVSGLVAEFLIVNPNAPTETIKKIEKPRDRSLKARFEDVPAVITGLPSPMGQHKALLGALFGEYQKRRNAFVHCEPGPSAAKESFFHQTDRKTVSETVSLTTQAIRAAWEVVYNTDGPRWLPELGKGGFLDKSVQLIENQNPLHNDRAL